MFVNVTSPLTLDVRVTEIPVGPPVSVTVAPERRVTVAQVTTAFGEPTGKSNVRFVVEPR